MGRIELRYSTPYLRDGLAGTAKADGTTQPASGDTTLTLADVALNTKVPTQVPIGARFTIAGETTPQTHVVTARTPTDGGPTTQVTFTPALGAGTYAEAAAVTFKPQLLEIKIGDGDLKYSENKQYHYDLNRGLLDVVRDGDDVPLDVNLNFTWEYTKSGTNQPASPVEAIKGIGAAAEWVSSDTDPCQPYAVDVIVDYIPPCAPENEETYVFPLFRAEKKDHDFKTANVAISGKCNVTEPVITRGPAIL